MKKLLNSLLILNILLFTYFPSYAQEDENVKLIREIFLNEGEKYFRFQLDDHVKTGEFSRIISIDKIGSDGWVYAYANKKEFSKFLALNFSYEILPHPGDFEGDLNIMSSIDIRELEEWDFYPTYDAYLSMMYQFGEEYPSICQVVSAGPTVQGRELLLVRISDNIEVRENEPQVLYTSSMHGDELTGYVLMLRLIDYLLSNYGTDPRVTYLVNNIEIWINPLANPDGTYAGGNNTVNDARRYNALWIDLNRNYPDPADGPHPDGNAWQAETVAFMNLAEANNFALAMNIHGGTEVCNYPWDTWSRLSADDAWWKFVCHEYADTAQFYSPSGYMTGYDDGITNGYAWYRITGGRQDYMNYFQQAREFTLEISEIKLLPPAQLPALWNYNYRSFLNYLEQSLYGLRGIVTDSVTGLPVRAEVYAVSHEMDSSWVYSSLTAGNYHRYLPAGNYTMRFSAPGYYTKTVNNVSIANYQTTVLDVQLVPDGVGGVEQNKVSDGIFVYPNPVRGNTIHFHAHFPVYTISLINITGEVVFTSAFNKSSGEVDLRLMDNGLYFLYFHTREGLGLKGIIINR